MFPKSVVLAYDFSQEMKKLMDRLPDLKNIGIEEVFLLHVSDVTRSGSHGQISKKNRSEKLESVKEKIEDIGFESVKKDVHLGFPSEEIPKFAKDKNSMLLIGSHGRGVVKNVFLGGTAYDIIRKAKTPVFVEKVKNESPPKNVCKKILLPTDFSDDSNHLFNILKESEFRPEEIILLSVIEESESSEELEKKREDLKVKLKTLKEELEKSGFCQNIDYRVEEGAASRMIAKTARSEDISLICMPNRGHGGLKEIIIGTTAKEVTRLSSVPVLLFPRESL